MPIFYVLSGPDIGKTYELDDGATLGRAIECEATLRGTSISRKHARLAREGKVWTLVDLDSRNGLHQNGVRVDRVSLVEGGTFHVGDLELRFREEAQGVQLLRKEAEPEPEIDFGEEEFEEPSAEEGIAFEGEELFESSAQQEARRAATPANQGRGPRPGGPLDSSPAPKPRGAPSASASRQAQRMAAAGIRPPASSAKLSDGRPVLQFTKPQASEGFFFNDLGQYPLWVRLAAGLVATLLFVGLFYFAFRGANTLKSRAVNNGPSLELEDGE